MNIKDINDKKLKDYLSGKISIENLSSLLNGTEIYEVLNGKVVLKKIERYFDKKVLPETNKPIQRSVAVCVSTYSDENYFKFLQETITSIDRQSCKANELYLVIDGKIEVPKFVGQRWRIIRTDTGEVSKGRNSVSKISKCEWISFVDGDDIMPNGWIQHCKSILPSLKDNVGVLYGDIRFFGEDEGHFVAGEWESDVFSKRNDVSYCSLWKTEAIRRCGWPSRVLNNKDSQQLAARLSLSWYVGIHHHGSEFLCRKHKFNFSNKPYIIPSKDLERSICLISCIWGKGLRVDAARKAITMWNNQTISPHIVFVEALDETQEESLYADVLPQHRTTHIILKYDRYNQRGLMQKETLINIGAKYASDYDVLVFIDADVWSYEAEWFERIAEVFANDSRDLLVHGHRHMTDYGEEIINWFSLGSKFGFDLPDTEYRQPGLCWAMRRSYYEKIGGINESCISGSGDVMMLDELAPGEYTAYKHIVLNFYRFSLRTNLPRPVLTFADSYVIHEHHGSFKERAYWHSRYVIDWTNRSVNQLVKYAENGMLVWKNPKIKLADVLADKPTLGKLGIDKATEVVGFLKYNYNEIFGWFDFENVYKMIVDEAPENSTIVEIGALIGKSTCFLAVDAHNSGKNLRIISCDIFCSLPQTHEIYSVAGCSYVGDGNYQWICERNVKNSKAEIELRKIDGLILANEFQDESVFAVWIDASHEYPETKAMIEAWYPKVSKGGFLGGHDYINVKYPGVKQVVDEFVKRYNLNCKIDGISFVIKK